MTNSRDAEVTIVGAGPGGLAAARCLAAAGKEVVLIDEAPQPGGRVWAGTMTAVSHEAEAFFARGPTRITMHTASRVIAANPREIMIEHATGTARIRFETLILATGARELQLPFPGWTIPGVMGAGGLQLMAKAGMNFDGKRVVLAGSGPLLLASAVSLRAAGARVLAVAEQAPWRRMLPFAATLLGYPDRLGQALKLRAQLGFSGIHWSTRVLAATGDNWLQSVTLQHANGKKLSIACDYLGVSFGLVPNIELAALLGCSLTSERAVAVDAFGQTTIANVYAVGEMTGIGGKAKALLEGECAALKILGREQDCKRLARRLAAEQRYAALLQRCFAVRETEFTPPTPDTIVCRCEDVTWQQVAEAKSWREARLESRCGMGYCQGRSCGAALAVLKGFVQTDWREPVYPCRLTSLTQLGTHESHPLRRN